MEVSNATSVLYKSHVPTTEERWVQKAQSAIAHDKAFFTALAHFFYINVYLYRSAFNTLF
jgi:hypothetical protein